jgi:hypothetical protein
MSMPGFTAGASLARSASIYVTGLSLGTTSSQLVLPALPISGGGGTGVGTNCPTFGPCDSNCMRTVHPCKGGSFSETCCLPGFRCESGTCVCPAPNTNCGTTCTNTQTDPNNCGSCGHSCNGGSCVGGRCNCSSAPGLTLCGNTCVNLQTDPANCGSCGNVCPPGTTCGNAVQSGACTGLVSDSELLPGDVLVFVPTDLIGGAVDLASGLDGYSHAGILASSGAGLVMFDVDNTNDPNVPQVEIVDLQTALQRGHVGVRFPLSNAQIQAMGPCLMAQVGEPMDQIALVTFGAIQQKGSEVCTMLIMHCLDQVGFNRSAMGLGGFVSPNEIARAFNAPQGDNTWGDIAAVAAAAGTLAYILL